MPQHICVVTSTEAEKITTKISVILLLNLYHRGTNLYLVRFSVTMVYSRFIIICVVFTELVSEVYVLENGVARTPPMGWMSWGFYMCNVDCDRFPQKCLNEKLILSVADTFFIEGYQEAGYEYIIIDDCWSEKKRDSNGRLVADRKRFPNGMKYIADYIHARGLKFGMYTNVAEVTCMHYPGSKNYFHTDAETFSEWGVDYIKVDGCFVGEDSLNTAYIEFGAYLNQTNRPMVYSCSWPYYIQFIHHKKPDFHSISKYCNMWRNYHDVYSSWLSVREVIYYFETNYEELHKYHGPGHWNDPDMLIFGQGLLLPEQCRSLISVFAMMSAPLLLSCDMRNIGDYEKQLLLNLDLIAVAQDPLGIMAKPYQIQKEITLWVKPQYPMKGDSYPSYSFLLLNLELDQEVTVSFTPAEYGLNSTDGYTVMDVFTGTYLRNVTLKDKITATIHIEDAVMYTLYPL